MRPLSQYILWNFRPLWLTEIVWKMMGSNFHRTCSGYYLAYWNNLKQNFSLTKWGNCHSISFWDFKTQIFLVDVRYLSQSIYYRILELSGLLIWGNLHSTCSGILELLVIMKKAKISNFPRWREIPSQIIYYGILELSGLLTWGNLHSTCSGILEPLGIMKKAKISNFPRWRELTFTEYIIWDFWTIWRPEKS